MHTKSPRLPFSTLIVSLISATVIATPFPTSAQEIETQRGVPFMTVRNKTSPNARNPYFGQERSDLKAGWCDIGQRWLGLPTAVADAAPFHIPEEILRIEKVRDEAPGAVIDALETTAADSVPVLYTHGFYIDFEKGCMRATILQENAKLQNKFMWFSWPSDGDLLNYTHDEADLYWSLPDLADTIAEMEAEFGSGQVHLAGHSLGGRGMALALMDVAARHPDVRLGELVLLAPDMDFEIFSRILPRIRPIVSGITVYVAEADRPLALSTTLHGYSRLGEVGNDVEKLDGVEVIDLSALPVRSPTGHLYHVYNQEVGDDLNQIFNNGKRADERHNLVQIRDNVWSLQPNE
ncbi:alpha/beta hydrolase [Roseovarius sp. EL26]|uniref:alpha/beta hydrolase n=1 Tax=Roseovarius sp. EL26 TaxID=2126672 RepID=UPI000EA1B312|nr:alpha/beta fold hydrolase [Roseovarius sp. EL26]